MGAFFHALQVGAGGGGKWEFMGKSGVKRREME